MDEIKVSTREFWTILIVIVLLFALSFFVKSVWMATIVSITLVIWRWPKMLFGIKYYLNKVVAFFKKKKKQNQ